jgi:hypothetical protein
MGQHISTSEPMHNQCSNDTSQDDSTTPIFLTAAQSCGIHGWSNPKRILTWKDFSSSSSTVTVELCIQSGVRPSDLHAMQPDIQKWIEFANVSFKDVPGMLMWPLHPVKHLRGDISDLAQMRYSPIVLEKLGISYSYMRTELLMDDNWMKMLKYRPNEWHKYLAFTKEHADSMGDIRTLKVFGMQLLMLKLAMTAG